MKSSEAFKAENRAAGTVFPPAADAVTDKQDEARADRRAWTAKEGERGEGE